MNFEVLIVFVVLAFILVSLYFEILGPSFTFVIAISVLGVSRILTPAEILSGFANVQLVVILLLLLLGDIFRQTPIMEMLFDKVFKGARTYKGFMLRMMTLVAGFSAFLNNTPLVAIMMPYVHNWSKRNNTSPSKLLIPLSYAAILGGCATLIGTSTNLIVNGMVLDQEIIPGLPSLDMFDFFPVGAAMAVIGIAYMLLFSKKLLPERKDAMSQFRSRNREYILQTQINEGSPLAGKDIRNESLDRLKGLYLVEVIRDNERIPAISLTTQLRVNDQLVFAGDTETIADIITQTDSGLSFPTLGSLQESKNSEVVEVVISHNSSLIGKTVMEANFRGRYDAAIIAIHRNGERISGKITFQKLKAGDVLLLFVGKSFESRSAGTLDFYYISKVKAHRKLANWQYFVLFGGTGLAILLSALRLVPLFTSLLVLIILINMLKIYPPKDIPKSIDYELAMVIALSLALGTAMLKTGVAEMLANSLISIFLPFGKVALLAGIFLITSLLANLITNKAAVALIFPISLTMASNLSLPPQPFILVVAFAAAANFMTPIGYQTNLMVYGPGGYSFRDFFKIGFPLTILYMAATVTILGLTYLR
ncbi:SLC13 family permease [Prolixibacter denitrificans]|uniref:Di/tricarboxylate transporter n=1 Tax=Prolixibacter denitrificans TaxID=1541063 RepID=A0A2P8C726_9BACT|nr:SLC13 family permease [Prolixibacter denitrificans]PSK80780.1 di/tricarboxylate transporter [Prolixibacter denitrificans]GET22420.1 potassium transporter TrkA [Prolixibacter denitrificans]